MSEHRAAPCDSASLDIMPASVRTHRLQRMLGRDPRENHRTATPLELLFDLTFVVAFSFAGNEVAHAFAEGHWSVGIEGFLFVTFGIIWAGSTSAGWPRPSKPTTGDSGWSRWSRCSEW